MRHFIAGPENRLVEVGVRAVLEGPFDGYYPLVFRGPSGTGKSHLARGLAAAWKAIRGGRVVYTTASDFAGQLADAIQTQATDEFRAKHRKAALLVFEDVDRLATKRSNKPLAQEELIHTLDALLASGRRVVVTASAGTAQLPGMLPGLQSRLATGLTVPLVPPGRDARQTILLELAALQRMKLSRPAAWLLADAFSATVPELCGVLTRLELPARLGGGRIDAKTVRRFLAHRNGLCRPPLGEIATATARHFSLRLSELRSPSRSRAVVTARGVAMYLARHLTEKSLEQIGRYFGGRDHTTVMHACRKTEDLIQTDPARRQAVRQLQQKWQEPNL